MGSPFARFLALAIVLGGIGAAAGFRFTESGATPAQSVQLLTHTGSSSAFQAAAQRWLEEFLAGTQAEQRDSAAALRVTLMDGAPVASTRAAVLLGSALKRLPVSPAYAALRRGVAGSLRERLASRIDTGARWSVGADVATARALDAVTEPSAAGHESELGMTLDLLIELSCGSDPHPNLAVRVECAAAALTLLAEPALFPDEDSRLDASDAALTGFLLAVLRAETPDQQKSPRTWPRITTLAWVKTRASMALARRTGLEDRYRPDGSWAHQVAEANRLEAAL
ncbi:MAG: hypothetical protein AAGG01_07865 [Planctomycetota bacterium]